MGQLLDKPKIEKSNDSGEGPMGLRYGLGAMQGWRVEMEDAHITCPRMPSPYNKCSFFAVLDGHAGNRVSNHVAETLLDCVLSTPEFKENGDMNPDKVVRALKQAFLNMDAALREMPEVSRGEDKSGSTAISCFITPEYIFLANVGDSRAIVVQNGKVVLTTLDHKPMNPEEKQRIQNAGGMVILQRVNGSLAVSRTLGDFDYKNDSDLEINQQLVIADADIFTHVRNHKTDDFVVLACDGVWDVMSNDELCTFIHSKMKISSDLIFICNEVLDLCLGKGSKDNMSIIIVAFPAAPHPQGFETPRREPSEQRAEYKTRGHKL